MLCTELRMVGYQKGVNVIILIGTNNLSIYLSFAWFCCERDCGFGRLFMSSLTISVKVYVLSLLPRLDKYGCLVLLVNEQLKLNSKKSFSFIDIGLGVVPKLYKDDVHPPRTR